MRTSQNKTTETTDEQNMHTALTEAKKAATIGEVPVGAVVVSPTGKLLAAAHNLCETKRDPTAHAEILAIRAAAQAFDNRLLTGCVLYVTLEPCPMCAGAIWASRLARVVFGAADIKAGACESVFNIVNYPYLNHQSQVTAGVLEDECRAVLREFFAQRR